MSEVTIGQEQIRHAYELIRTHVRRTPVVEADAVEFGLDPVHITFKLECLQHAGSFKSRGAFTNLLTREVPAAGVTAASGGNHGAAVAYAAKKLGKPAAIFVPKISSPAKIERIRSYGANLVVGGEQYTEALAASDRYSAETGALRIHAYDQPETLFGQGTVGLEFEEQAPHLDTLLVAVGGGGLIGGIAAWYRGRVKLVGVEPEAAPTLLSALQAGELVDVAIGGIAADSLGARRAGRLMFPIAQAHVSEVVLVPDEFIVEAQRRLWDVLRVATEPGGAAAFGALLSGRYVPKAGERVGVLVCGSNTTAVAFG